MSELVETIPDLHRLPSTELDLHALEIDDVLYHLFQFISPLELCSTTTLICKYWRDLVKNYKSYWTNHCEAMWRGKFYILSEATKLLKTDPLNAYKISYIDRKRNVINYEELTSIQWHFRFKFASPLHITNLLEDENGNQRIIIADFQEDGTLIHEPIRGSFHWQFVKKRERKNDPFNFFLRDLDEDCHEAKAQNEEINFGYDEDKEIKEGIKGKSRWVQVNHFPAGVVSRNGGNWGWIIQNTYVIFTSY